jgi:putative ABC transport system substrate-binding protein
VWTREICAQAKIARIGVLASFDARSKEPVPARWWEPFRRTLAEYGWIEGETVSFEFRGAFADPSQLAEAASDIVERNCDVIWAVGAPFTRAAHATNSTVPIVAIDFTTDPIAEGYAENFGRPGRNITGIFLDAPQFAGKWLEVLKRTVPGLLRIAVIWDPSPGRAHLHGVQSMARALGLQVEVAEVHKPEDIDRAFAAFRGRPQALVILPSPMLFAQSPRLAKLALEHRLPATSMTPYLFTEAGGLVGYGPDDAAGAERSAVFVAKILRGANPGQLPLERPSKFAFVLNLKTAKALGLTVPEAVLVGADKVIR